MAAKIVALIGFGMAAVVGMWELLQIEAIDNALIQFATAGVVPGTGVVLSPGQVFIVLSATLLLAICILFRQGLARDLRRVYAALRAGMRRRKPATETALALQAAPAVMRAQGKPIVLVTLPAKPGKLVQIAQYIQPHVRPALQVAVHMARRYGVAAWRWVVQAVVAADRKSRIYTAQAWHAIEPRIRVLDGRIERALKRNPKSARIVRAYERELAYISTQYAQWRARAARTTDSAVEK